MIKYLIASLFIASLAPLAHAPPTAYPPSARESIEWCDIWLSHAHEANLPRAFLIGDSITRAYYPDVERKSHRQGSMSGRYRQFPLSSPIPPRSRQIALVLTNNEIRHHPFQ